PHAGSTGAATRGARSLTRSAVIPVSPDLKTRHRSGDSARQVAASTVVMIWPGIFGSGPKALGKAKRGVCFGAGPGATVIAQRPARLAYLATRTAATASSAFVAPGQHKPSLVRWPSQ